MLDTPVFPSFQEAYVTVLREVHDRPQFVNAPRGNAARERLNVSFAVQNPQDRMVYLPARRINIVFCFAEALWYLWGRDDLEMISYYAPRMKAFSADGKTLTGTAYGPKLFRPAEGGLSQWQRIVDLLAEDPESKRAVAALFHSGEPLHGGNPDVSCTLGLQYLLRDGRLHLACYMRGNDALLGLACDVFSFTLIQEFTAHHLGVDLGTYTHHAGSMHINDGDAAQVAAILEPAPPPPRFPVPAMPPTGWSELRTIEGFEERLRRDQAGLQVSDRSWLGLPRYWQQVVLLLEAYRQIVHRPGAPITPPILEALDPAYRWLVAHRWPDRIPEPFASPAGGPR
jgi:thymidylate synthase